MVVIIWLLIKLKLMIFHKFHKKNRIKEIIYRKIVHQNNLELIEKYNHLKNRIRNYENKYRTWNKIKINKQNRIYSYHNNQILK